MVPLLFFFFRINAKAYYIAYIVHDLFWSLLFLVIGIILRTEAIDLGSFVSIFGNNYAYFIYTFISFGGVFLLLVVVFAAYANEIPFNMAKKIYIVWRMAISILHLFVCMFLVIFFGIFDSVMKNVLSQNNVSGNVTNELQTYFNIAIALSSFFVVYSIINIFNTYILFKACKKIQGDDVSEEEKRASKQEGWGEKVVPE